MILNLTQHPATAEQIAQGVVDLPADERAELSRLLTVDDLPSRAEIEDRCEAIAKLSWADSLGTDTPITRVMVGGAPWMMAPLCRALRSAGIDECLAAFSRRESVERTDPVTGAVTKTAVFRHIGFVECGL
jgi:hypothetical protein